MIEIKEITDINDSALDIYSRLTESQLRMLQETESGIFIAESPKVISMALRHGYRPLSLLCEQKHINGDARQIIDDFKSRPESIRIYTGTRQVLASITGYTLTRGVLCAMARKLLPSVTETCESARLVAVIQSVCDTTNIGSIFRAASALGVDAVVVSTDACDPLNRRSVRVSMGTVFSQPWTMIDDPVAELNRIGFKTAALALSDDSISLDNPLLKQAPRLAVVFGTEGDGLPQQIIDSCDYTVKIPMFHGVDSLNVASAAAVTFWELRRATPES